MQIKIALGVGCAMALGLAACGTAPNSDGSSSASADELRTDVDLGALRRNTAKYHDVQEAVNDGFVDSGECASSPPFVPPSQAGAMGIHYVNYQRAFAPVDSARPSILLYEPAASTEGSNERKLVGVEYVQFVFCDGKPWMGSGIPNDPSNPPPFASGTCFPNPGNPPTVFGQTFDGPMPGHQPGMPWHFDKHVWVWRHNPDGLFSEWNPRVSCTPKAD